MILRKIAYLIAMIISVFFYILFIGDISFYIMVFVFAFPAAMLAVLITGRILITIDADDESTHRSTRGEEASICFKIKNRSIFPFPRSVITVCCTNKVSGDENRFHVSLPINYLAEQKVMVTVISDNCGIMDVKAESLRIYDYIKLFSWRIRSLSAAHITVIPDIFDNGGFQERMRSAEESEVFSKVKSGDDPSEIFELKDYVPGDRLNRIHWNLSSVREGLITKHYSQGVSSPSAIVPDIDLSKDIQSINAAFDIFFSIACAHISLHGEAEIVTPYGDMIKAADHEELIKIFEAIIRNSKQSEVFDDCVKKALVENSTVYFVTNIPYDHHGIYDEVRGTAQRYYFVDSSLSEMKISEGDNIRIVRTSSDLAEEAFVKGL